MSTETSPIAASKITDLHELVERRGLLVHKDDADHIDFQFVCFGFPFAARASSDGQTTGIEVRANLGHLPYTAEGGGRRQGALETLAAAKRVFGRRVKLNDELKLILEDRRALDGPMTPANLLTEMTMMMIDAKPYLEALARYVRPETPSATADDTVVELEAAAETEAIPAG